MAQQALILFFEQVAQKNAGLLQEIELHDCFHVERKRWCFTLPDLHQFLAHRDDVFKQLEYRQFRQLIFKSPLNPAVKNHGADIQIAQNHAKVDSTLYALVWQEPTAHPAE